MLEDEDNCFHLKNLSQHLATNEEEALNLLFVGDTNRMISATPMNLASSRSHCIFTVTVEARKAGEDTVRKSKLHLVDLAGSERVWKKGIDGQILKEAKYINLSLHYLEQVIIALQERSQGKPRHHIPYRNSMMTSVLRDSLGGNCLTVMIATVTVAQEQLEETISTCRFAQRVALVSNQVMLNEEVDPSMVIKRLKQEIKDLKEELHLLRGGEERGPLTAAEMSILKSQISCYIADKSDDATLNCGGTMLQIRAAFQLFKQMFLETSGRKNSVVDQQQTDVSTGILVTKNTESKSTSTLQETISNLNHQLQQRDNEINILVSFIRKREKATLKKTMSTQAPEISDIGDQCASSEDKGTYYCAGPVSKDVEMGISRLDDGDRDQNLEQSLSALNCQGERLKAFEVFKASYPSWDAIEENKKILKEKYSKAKSLGEKVNKARERINLMKSQIEKIRVEKALQSLTQGVQTLDCEDDSAEENLICTIEKEKRVYKDNFNDLRDLKKEIEHLHIILQQNRIRLQNDFEKWLNPSPRQVFQPSQSTSDVQFRSWINGLMQNQSSQLPQLPSTPDSVSRTSKVLSMAATKDSRTTEQLISTSSKGQEIQDKGRTHRAPTPQSTRSSTCGVLEEETPIQLTGDVDTDADILAFYQARADILSGNSR
ncbi:kinesin family member 6/9 [Marchantia polymorpha subsp. ruderalis]|nr:hypothetical protein MARPO_0119s0045 [Marchantia polymorpha]BBN08880.1 hypothetical protein Mp_4g15210 [Marchantia polymorpha subsp. ruderalis]|eukprot:PTQ30846.1 hypothetical protein MARPO_0119s0045 [Marchantia polymorpha]